MYYSPHCEQCCQEVVNKSFEMTTIMPIANLSDSLAFSTAQY